MGMLFINENPATEVTKNGGLKNPFGGENRQNCTEHGIARAVISETARSKTKRGLVPNMPCCLAIRVMIIQDNLLLKFNRRHHPMKQTNDIQHGQIVKGNGQGI